MMRGANMERKKVTYRHLKIGDEVVGHDSSGTYSGFWGVVTNINPNFVTIRSKTGYEKQYSTEGYFYIELTEEEFRKKYNEKAGEIIKALQNQMYLDEIGPHTMYNAWISSNPWELAAECQKRNYQIVVYCKDIVPKGSYLSDTKLDIGICAEYEKHKRFWCHFSSYSLYMLKKRYERYQRWLAEEGEKEEFKLYSFEDEEEMEVD